MSGSFPARNRSEPRIFPQKPPLILMTSSHQQACIKNKILDVGQTLPTWTAIFENFNKREK